MENLLSQLTAKQHILKTGQIANLDEWFAIELTYTSNAIEGNTLSRAETALVVEKGLTVDGKTLQEHLEAVNHDQAWKLVKTLPPVNEVTILDLHGVILSKIDDTNAGRYRTVPVRIAGSTVILPNPVKVPELMKQFIQWLKSQKDHPVKVAAMAHYKLVTIHPFTDGNGRTARLLMNLLLLQAGYPPAIIRKEDRRSYINALEQAQLGGSLEPFLELVYLSVLRSFDHYIEAKTPPITKPLKIGQLAKLVNEPVPTLQFWAREGLLRAVGKTRGGYQLFDTKTVDRIALIRKFQDEARLTLAEIKNRLDY